MSKKTKEVKGTIKLQVPAAKATPAPPIGPAAGQKGLNPAEFCKAINDATKKYEPGTPVRIFATAYTDRSFEIEIKGCPTSFLILKTIGVEKGSQEPGRKTAGTITEEQIAEVAKKKLEEGISARSIESAIKSVKGTARSMGLKVIGAENNG